MSNVNEKTNCNDCGHQIDESSTHERSPCPKCGSTNRKFSIEINETITLHSDIQATVTAIDNSSILLQTVIVPGGKTKTGLFVEMVSIPWFTIIQLINDDPKIAFQLTPEKWEELIAGAYSHAGFDEVILTPRSGDLGRDVIAIKKGLGEVRIIDQVKAYKPGHLVKANDVRALMGVLQTDGASKGFLTTTSDFAPKISTDPLIQPLIPKQLELINGTKLMERLSELSKK